MDITRILRHVKPTKIFGMKYKVEDEAKLIGYLDSDQSGYQDDKKNTL